MNVTFSGKDSAVKSGSFLDDLKYLATVMEAICPTPKYDCVLVTRQQFEELKKRVPVGSDLQPGDQLHGMPIFVAAGEVELRYRALQLLADGHRPCIIAEGKNP